MIMKWPAEIGEKPGILKIILNLLIITLLIMNSFNGKTQAVKITIDADATRKSISPYIFGKNNVLPSTFLNSGTTAEITKANEAGVKIVRQGGGNNSTKYNWRKKLSSHPDWYNNVYDNNWDAAAKNLTMKMPGVMGMWSFQLLGKVADNNKNNFPDWTYNQSKWWEGVAQNLAGGGTPNPAGGSKALVEGNPDLYLTNWPTDSTVKILDHWFNVLKYDSTYYKYWNMDNEPEIWSGTHDDVMKTQPGAEDFLQAYFKVAKAARAKFQGIKLVGPVPANEWQWYRWGSDGISYKGKKYCWLEYFILRIAEEQKLTGIRLLDVLDIHYYPSSTDPAKVVQYHRVFFDRNYVYPEANGVKTVNGGWDNSINKEYIFGRCSDWLNKYMGTGHGVTFGVTESGIPAKDANVQASWYASTLGEFMKNGVEIFTPWSWDTGMWETLHLFSRYSKKSYIPATSTDENNVSAYPTINETGDSITIFLVNRHLTETKNVEIDVKNFAVFNGPVTMYSLSKLPATETFVSHKQNALKTKTIEKLQFHIPVQLDPLSVNAVVLSAAPTANQELHSLEKDFKVYPNPASEKIHLEFELIKPGFIDVELVNINGQKIKKFDSTTGHQGFNQIELTVENINAGMYWLVVTSDEITQTKKIIIN